MKKLLALSSSLILVAAAATFVVSAPAHAKKLNAEKIRKLAEKLGLGKGDSGSAEDKIREKCGPGTACHDEAVDAGVNFGSGGSTNNGVQGNQPVGRN